MLSDAEIKKHVATIMQHVMPHVETKEQEEIVIAGVALFTSFMIALHTGARK